MIEKSCSKCGWLRKYTDENSSWWMNVCECSEPEEDDDGLFLVITIDVERFDASNCLGFKDVEVKG